VKIYIDKPAERFGLEKTADAVTGEDKRRH